MIQNGALICKLSKGFDESDGAATRSVSSPSTLNKDK